MYLHKHCYTLEFDKCPIGHQCSHISILLRPSLASEPYSSRSSNILVPSLQHVAQLDGLSILLMGPPPYQWRSSTHTGRISELCVPQCGDALQSFTKPHLITEGKGELQNVMWTSELITNSSVATKMYHTRLRLQSTIRLFPHSRGREMTTVSFPGH